jgi:anti-anti-sigma factor
MADDICILSPHGRLDGTTSPAFERDVAKSIAAGTDKLLLDMAGLQYISSAGLRVVLHAAKQMKAKGGQLILCALSEQVREVFEISGFLGILTVSRTREEAMKRLAE